MPVEFLSNTETKLLIDEVKKRFRVDFSVYSSMSFQRRSFEFFRNHNIESTNDFLRRAEKEVKLLQYFIKDISVQETEMFRDPDFWKILANDVLINLLSKKGNIKIWLPDSTTGEELYSLAIILFEKSFVDRTKIIVSSTSEISINNIKEGLYTSKKMEQNKGNYVRYKGFESEFSLYYKELGNKRKMNEELLQNVDYFTQSFHRKNELKEIDIIICRNKLLYYDYNYKNKLLGEFSESLANAGYLAVGIKEALPEEIVGLKFYNENERIYIKK